MKLTWPEDKALIERVQNAKDEAKRLSKARLQKKMRMDETVNREVWKRRNRIMSMERELFSAIFAPPPPRCSKTFWLVWIGEEPKPFFPEELRGIRYHTK